MLIAIEESAYDAIEANEEDALQWLNADLALGVPAFFDDEVSGETWLVWSAWNMSLEDVAWWGCMFDNVRRVGRLWEAPKKPGSDDVDVEAASVETRAMIDDLVVLPDSIAYFEVVDVEVPVRVREERVWVDPETGEEFTYFVWVDTGETVIVQEERPFPNPAQVTLDAQGVDVAKMAAFDQVPVGWSPRQEVGL